VRAPQPEHPLRQQGMTGSGETGSVDGD
jgi:hypothetical protein